MKRNLEFNSLKVHSNTHEEFEALNCNTMETAIIRKGIIKCIILTNYWNDIQGLL